MKSITTILSILLFSNLIAQTNSIQLEHNNVSAHISDVGTYFLDHTNSIHGYEVPKGSGQHAIYTTQFWFAGKDPSNEVRLIQGGSPTSSDVFNGPISGSGTYTSPSYQNTWENSIWSICQADIDHYKAWWECDNGITTVGCSSLSPPSIEVLQTIYSWPAHGDVSDGQSYYLAPYFDYNLDGMYNPANGDYPIIKGCCAVYMIQNDAAQSHTYSSTDSLGVELHIMFYQYQTWDYLNDVTFVDLKAVNRSNTNYSDFISSIYVDADLGYYGDDFFGCDSVSNTMYFYNGDNYDENIGGIIGYGLNPPALGIVGLNSEMTSCVPIYSASNVNQKWNQMNGFQTDGSPWLNPNSDPTKYVFSGNPNVPNEWSAIDEGQMPNDVRGLANFYHGDFNSGDTISQTYAITFTRNGNYLDNVNDLLNISNEIKTFHENQSNEPCQGATWGINNLDLNQFSLHPNPTKGLFNIVNEQQIDFNVQIFDGVGRLIENVIAKNKPTVQINLENHPKGIYTVKIVSEKDVQSFKVILD